MFGTFNFSLTGDNTTMSTTVDYKNGPFTCNVELSLQNSASFSQCQKQTLLLLKSTAEKLIQDIEENLQE